MSLQPHVDRAILGTMDFQHVLGYPLEWAIEDDGDLAAVSESLQEMAGTLDSVEKVRREYTQPLDAAKQAIMEAYRPIASHLTTSQTQAKQAIAAYRALKERERKQLEAELAAREKQRIIEETQQQVDDLLNAGKIDEATALVDSVAGAPPPAPTVLPAAKPNGISSRTVWSAEVVNMRLLLKAIVDGRVPENLVVVNQSALNAFARANKGTLAVPGLNFKKEESIVAAHRGA